jgi:hypothetical protein
MRHGRGVSIGFGLSATEVIVLGGRGPESCAPPISHGPGMMLPTYASLNLTGPRSSGDSTYSEHASCDPLAGK